VPASTPPSVPEATKASDKPVEAGTDPVGPSATRPEPKSD
jgi:hypothetical protein